MKTKILALILAICCLSATLVACSKQECEAHVDENKDLACDVCGEAVESETETETETESDVVTEPEVICGTHKDENADKICDACGKAVVVIVEQIKPEAETRVDMIVNTVDPNSTATKENYINTGASSNVNATATEIKFVKNENEFYWVRTENTAPAVDGTGLPVVTSYNNNVYNALTDKKLFETDIFSYVTTNFDISFDEYFFTVKQVPAIVTDPVNGAQSQTITYTYYTYTGEKIYELVWAGAYVYDSTLGVSVWRNQDGLNYDEAFAALATKVDAVDGLAYVTIAGTTYVIDPETDKIVHKESANTIVRRPVFDEVNGNYGYIFDEANGYLETIYVYDLAKWIECVYSYDVPSYYTGAKAIVLDNGNILLSYYRVLNANAVSYDTLYGDNKIDMVYAIIDMETKSESTVEFGYWIVDAVESAMLKDVEAVNVLKVYPIESDNINRNAPKYLVVDNTLKVLFDLGAAVNFEDGMSVVGDNLFKVEANVGGQGTSEILGATGNHVAYVPSNAIFYRDYLVINNRLYTCDMKELEGYTAAYCFADYAIATKADELGVIKHYFVNVVDGAFTTTPIEYIRATDIGYIASVQVPDTDEQGQPKLNADGTPVMKADFRFYDVNGTMVVDVADVIGYVGVNALGENVYAVRFADGTDYIVKY